MGHPLMPKPNTFTLATHSPLLMEMKQECVVPKESEEVFAVLAASQIPSDDPSTSP